MLSFAFFLHVKLPAVNGYLGCARNAGKAFLSLPLVGIFCLHSKYTTGHNPSIDLQPSDAKGLIIIYDTSVIQEMDIPQSPLAISHIVTV